MHGSAGYQCCDYQEFPSIVSSIRTDKNEFQPTLVVLRVRRSGVELEVAFDNLVNSAQKILLSCHLPPRPNGEHASLGAYTAQLGTRGVGAQARDEFPPDVALNRHALGVNPEDVGAALEVR